MKRRDMAAPALCCALLAAASFTVFYALAGRGGSDIGIHGTWASEIVFNDIRSFVHHGMHPMWHTLVALVLRLGAPLRLASALVTTALKAMQYLLSYALLCRKLKSLPAALAAVAPVLAGPLCLPFVNPTIYAGVGTPNTWHSPTQLIAVAFMLVCVPMTAGVYEDFENKLGAEGGCAAPPWKKAALLSALLLLSLFAKPTFMQAFLPATGVFFLIEWLRRPKSGRFFRRMILVFLPSVLFMVFQYLYYFGIIVPSQGSVALSVSPEKAWEIARNTLLIQAFPIYVLLTLRKKGVYRDRLVWLSLLLDIAGVIEMLLLSETGRRAGDGNFGWAMMSGALMLWTVMLMRFISGFAEYRRGPCSKRDGAVYIGGFALLIWHLGGGLYYMYYLITNNVNL